MKPVRECILITEPMFIGMFSGSDVWLIPVEWAGGTDEDPNTTGIRLDWGGAYTGDNWYLQEGVCYGYRDEPCVIAVEPEQMMWRTAPLYASQNDF